MAPNNGIKRGIGMGSVFPNVSLSSAPSASSQGTVLTKDTTKEGGLKWQFGAPGPIVSLTASYTVLATDVGTVFACNGSSLTMSLPLKAPPSPWMVSFININSSLVTVSPNGLNLDGSSGSVTLGQNQGITVFSDGTNYFYGAGSIPNTTLVATLGTTTALSNSTTTNLVTTPSLTPVGSTWLITVTILVGNSGTLAAPVAAGISLVSGTGGVGLSGPTSVTVSIPATPSGTNYSTGSFTTVGTVTTAGTIILQSATASATGLQAFASGYTGITAVRTG